MSEKALQALQDSAELFQEVMKSIEQDQEQFWSSLSKDEQLKAFCAVARRIYQGELVDKGSYRYVLYEVFGFGPEAYVQAQDAGYLELHNAIYAEDHDKKLLRAFCSINQIENAEEKIKLAGF